MKKLLAMALLAGASMLAANPAGAATGAPRVQLGTANVVQVSGGCGPYAFRALDGYCHPMRYVYAYAPPPPPPVYYRPACGYGWHPSPWGCRPNW
jgi:hypothetical protein